MQTTCRLFATPAGNRICTYQGGSFVTEEVQNNQGISRRTIMKGAAWSVPVIAAAVATPMAAASGDAGDFQVNGSCGGLGLLGVGFDITAGAVPLPTGTTITISTTGILNLGVLTATGGLADVVAVGNTGNLVTLRAPLAAGTTLSLRTLLSVGVGSTMTAVATPAAGYTAGAGAKSTGTVEQVLIVGCEAG